jgi:hypothetical protein
MALVKPHHHIHRRQRFIIGAVVFVALVVLTLVEWAGAIYATKPMLVIAPAAAAKALLILAFFMHVRELWAVDELAEADHDLAGEALDDGEEA